MSRVTLRRVAAKMDAQDRVALNELLDLLPDGLLDKLVKALRAEFSDDAWRAYDAALAEIMVEEADTIIFAKLWVKIRVRHVRWLVERIATRIVARMIGPRPAEG